MYMCRHPGAIRALSLLQRWLLTFSKCCTYKEARSHLPYAFREGLGWCHDISRGYMHDDEFSAADTLWLTLIALSFQVA